MFNRPHDPLNDHVRQAAKPQQRWAARLGAVQALAQRFGQWWNAHWETLHHVWTYGLAFALAIMVFNPEHGWVNLAIVPVQVLFIGPLMALVELPTLAVLITLWAVGSECLKLAWRWLRQRAG